MAESSAAQPVKPLSTNREDSPKQKQPRPAVDSEKINEADHCVPCQDTTEEDELKVNGSVALPHRVPTQSAASDASSQPITNHVHVTISNEIQYSSDSSTSINDNSNETTRAAVVANDNKSKHRTIGELRQDSVFSRSAESAEFRFKVWKCTVGLCVLLVVVVVWGLCSIPIVLYHMPVCPNTTSTVSMETNTTNREQCSSPIPYNGDVCRNELRAFSNCLPNTNQRDINNENEPILIQYDQIERIKQLLSDFRQIASPSCMDAAVPFLCVYTLGLCDSAGRGYSLSSSQCKELSTGVCRNEWRLAELAKRPLPDCDSFPNETILMESCERGGSGLETTEEVVLEPDTTHPPLITQNDNAMTLCINSTCRDGFYCNGDTGRCSPRCGSFKQTSNTATLAVDIVVIIAASVGVLSGVAMLVIAITRRKKIFSFPTAFVVYQTISLLVLALFVIINYFDRERLYCSSEDLISSLENPTPFCIISGMVFYYTIFQVAIWWILHMAALLWKIQFPFHARKLRLNHIDRYVHILAIVLGLLLPLLPIIVAMSLSAVDERSNISRCGGGSSSLALQKASGRLGFGMTQFPPILCTGSDSNATYYSFNLLLNIILIVGMTMLIGIFWIIHKKHGLLRVKHSGRNVMSIGSAERKILLVFCYYFVLAIITLVTQSLVLRNREKFVDEVIKYFSCEQSGQDTCSREGFEELSYPALIALSYAFLTLFPLINFLFVVNIRETKERLRKWSSSVGGHSSTNHD